MSGRGGDDSEALGAVDWLAQKQHFFSFIAHPESGFSEVQAATVNGGDEDESIVKKFSSTATLNATVDGSYTLPFTFYIGPNHYQTLKDYDQGYEKVINFGWGIFGWIGRGVVVPIFNWLEGYGLGYGLIILIMVLIIKGAMSPLTFASYRSMAKMRVLKPQLDEMNKKFGEKDAVAKQQAQMALYKEAGVNPLGGCIPVIVQMPILIVMFRFFPADENGLADAWEQEHFETIGVDPDADADGDSNSNLMEFLAGTDPKDIGSHFKPEGSHNGTSHAIPIQTMADRKYEVFASRDLVNWHLQETYTGDGTQKTFSFDETTITEGPLYSATHPSTYFFRVKITGL